MLESSSSKPQPATVRLQELRTPEEAAAGAASGSDDDSDDYVWEWDEQLDPFEINVHTEDMVLAVSMTAAGHARCVDCALRLVRVARHSGADCEYDGAGLWDKVHQRSRPFPGEYPWITAEQLLDAVATDPRCSRSRAAQMARLTVSLRFLRAATELFPAVPPLVLLINFA